ncbi:hypothetical protein CRG98_034084 [Punica granatum]|uniref:Uncharacterized protein n=1 Tax=Punica granatum TaxID=22663 RepID=A0A2I0IQ63_PUNGR|nr:hypothetical protein CRG98_034084 [Punica granatum]
MCHIEFATALSRRSMIRLEEERRLVQHGEGAITCRRYSTVLDRRPASASLGVIRRSHPSVAQSKILRSPPFLVYLSWNDCDQVFLDSVSGLIRSSSILAMGCRAKDPSSSGGDVSGVELILLVGLVGLLIAMGSDEEEAVAQINTVYVPRGVPQRFETSGKILKLEGFTKMLDDEGKSSWLTQGFFFLSGEKDMKLAVLRGVYILSHIVVGVVVI